MDLLDRIVSIFSPPARAAERTALASYEVSGRLAADISVASAAITTILMSEGELQERHVAPAGVQVRAVVRTGFLRRGAALVTVLLAENAGGETEIRVRATAAGGRLGKRAAEEAVDRIVARILG